MPRPLLFAATAPEAVDQAARELGRRMKLARLRRRLSQRELASRAGVSYVTMRAIEAGNLLTGLGAYLAAIWALGLEQELETLLEPDKDMEGKQLELSRMPRRAREEGIRPCRFLTIAPTFICSCRVHLRS
jgi:transcriptional regulator with XRE-family HTH domain